MFPSPHRREPKDDGVWITEFLRLGLMGAKTAGMKQVTKEQKQIKSGFHHGNPIFVLFSAAAAVCRHRRPDADALDRGYIGGQPLLKAIDIAQITAP